MNQLHIAPIVEGDGDVSSVPKLLHRIARDLLRGATIHVEKPIRVPKTKLVRPGRSSSESEVVEREVERSVDLAHRNLNRTRRDDWHKLVLLLIDADEDCPARLAPRLLGAMRQPAAVVLACREYETWFASAASSLTRFLKLDSEPPQNAEAQRLGKAWIQSRFVDERSRVRRKYSETTDQAKLTAAMNLTECRRCPSFDKLVRELEKAIGAPPTP